MPVSDLRWLLLERANQWPQKNAYIFIDDSGKPASITYQQLAERAQAMAGYLSNQSALQSSRALLIYPPGFDFLYALFGCFYSNIQAIPIALPKPKTHDLFTYFIQHAKPQWILTHSTLVDRIQPFLNSSNSQAKLVCTDTLEALSNPILPEPNSTIALIQYTSGTTTLPKGVLVSFENLNHNLNAIQHHFKLTAHHVCYSWLPHYHDMGLIDGLLTPLFTNCLGILSSPFFVISNPANWLRVITEFSVNHTGGPNFFFDLCVEKVSQDTLNTVDLSSLTHLYVSAESVRKKTLERFASYFAVCGFQKELFTPGYGLAEATLMVSCKELNTPLHTEIKNGNEYIGLGRPIPDMKAIIINSETSKLTTGDEIGEICVSGPSLTPGYFADDQLTHDSRITIGNTTYFKTGDLGFFKDNDLFVVGRIKDTLNVRGTKYQPEDLEYIVAQCHPQLVAMPCAMISVQQETEKIVVLQEVNRHVTESQARTIRETIAQAIFIAFGLSVFDIKLLPPGSLEKTTSGKVKRLENRKRYEQGLL